MTARSKIALLVVFLLVFLVVIPVVALMTLTRPRQVLRGHTALVLDIGGSMLEYHPAFTPGLLFRGREMTLTEYLTCIDAAAVDPRVKALVLRMYPSAAGPAKCEELRSAIARFSETGKPVATFSPLLGDYDYLVACASDSIFMPPTGFLVVTGPASSAVFLRGTLDKLGIRPNIDRIGEYKSAAETYTEKRHTPASREMTERVLEDLYGRFVADIAATRDTSEATVRSWIDRGLFSPARALEYGLIDGIRYWDEVERSFEDRNMSLIEGPEYLRVKRTAGGLIGPRIAVIHAQGVIVMGESGIDPLSGPTMGSESIVDELRRARDSGSIKAVILRIDSPGGDGIAGDMISREVEMTRREKPVVVSMSDVAASGGYEIAYRANKIVAMPGTITGSIGVITGKMNMHGLYDKLGITKDEIGTGRMSLLYSDYRDFSDEEWNVIREENREFYDGWVREIAAYRGMSEDSVDGLGRGRIWTGSEAVANGLIDGIGGLDRAVGMACRLAGIADSSRVVLLHYPRRLGFMQEILSRNLLENAIGYAIYEVLAREDGLRRGLFIEHRAPEQSVR
jgi:protease-4